MKTRISIILLLISLSIITIASSLVNPQSSPSKTGRTLTDIDNLITNNSTTTGNYTLSTTSVPTYSNNPSISTIYTKLYNLLDPNKLKSGVTYLGVTGGQTRSATTTVLTSSFHPTADIEAQGYTLQDIYNLIHSSATTTAGNHSLTNSNTPESSMYSLTALYNDLVSLIQPGDIKLGNTYLGVTGTYYVLGKAAIFDGSNYIRIPASQSWDLKTFTISYWAYYDDFNGAPRIMGMLDSDNGFGIGNLWNYQTSFNYFANGQDNTEPVSGVNINEWHHYVLTRDNNTAIVKVYIDNVLVATFYGTNSWGDASYSDLAIGRRGVGEYLSGKIDELNIWNRVLSDSEIEDLDNSGNGLFGDIGNLPFKSGLIAGYNFDNDLNDFSGNGHDGTFLSSAADCSFGDEINCEKINGCIWTNGSSSDYYCSGTPNGNVGYGVGIVALP